MTMGNAKHSSSIGGGYIRLCVRLGVCIHVGGGAGVRASCVCTHTRPRVRVTGFGFRFRVRAGQGPHYLPPAPST